MLYCMYVYEYHYVPLQQTTHAAKVLAQCSYCDYKTRYAKFLINHYNKVHTVDAPELSDAAVPSGGSMRGVFTVCESSKTTALFV